MGTGYKSPLNWHQLIRVSWRVAVASSDWPNLWMHGPWLCLKGQKFACWMWMVRLNKMMFLTFQSFGMCLSCMFLSEWWGKCDLPFRTIKTLAWKKQPITKSVIWSISCKSFKRLINQRIITWVGHWIMSSMGTIIQNTCCSYSASIGSVGKLRWGTNLWPWQYYCCELQSHSLWMKIRWLSIHVSAKLPKMHVKRLLPRN